MKKTNAILLLAMWLVLTACVWFGPEKQMSDTERRPLAQFPDISGKTILNGSFMEKFEDYSLDQFPLRDGFRTLKSLFHTRLLGQKDNNGIYLHEGFAAKQEYPLNKASLAHAASRFSYLQQKYLTDSKAFFAIVPDKGYYLAEESGHLAMDYEELFRYFREELPWAEQIDLRDALSLEDYYRTDTHWRQEKLLPAAETLCNVMGITEPKDEDFTETKVDRPFYGVYYGQAALPMEPDTMVLLESDLLKNCAVYDHESGKTLSIYDESKLEAKDLYEIFLSGPRGLLTIENPAGKPGKELLVFRDSFGSAMIPLFLNDYETVTVIDIRYLQIDLLDRFVDFHGQDVLFLYSTLVLNNSETIK